jgi:molybdopterin synthase sulfur carrier subunit
MGITVRYWAAARDAAGLESEQIAAARVGELREALVGLHGAALGRVLEVSSLLVDGLIAKSDSVPLPDGCLVDVLPPFAGG